MLARKNDNKQLYAVKIITRRLFNGSGDFESLSQEKKILQNDSPFLVHLYFTFLSEQCLFFVMDFIGGGDLAFHIEHNEKFSETTAQFLIAELVLAIDYLHSRGVVYR